MELHYQMFIQPHHHHKLIDDCASEIAVYAGDHGNWAKPILPGGGSCPEMVFEPERFDQLRNLWTCSEQIHGKVSHT